MVIMNKKIVINDLLPLLFMTTHDHDHDEYKKLIIIIINKNNYEW